MNENGWKQRFKIKISSGIRWTNIKDIDFQSGIHINILNYGTESIDGTLDVEVDCFPFKIMNVVENQDYSLDV